MKIASYTTFAADLKKRGFEYAIAHTAALGFDGVEILHTDGPVYSAEDAKRAKERLDAYGLDVVCYSVGINLTPDCVQQSEAMLLHHAELAAVLGSPYLHHTLATSLKREKDFPSYHDIFDTVLQSSRRVANRCADLNLTCLYEPQGIYFNGIDALGHFFEKMKQTNSNVGICGDMGNSLFVDCDPVSLFQVFQNDIKHLHAKNYDVRAEQPIGTPHYRSLGGNYLSDASLQNGAVDLRACIATLDSLPSAIGVEMDGTDEALFESISYLHSIT